MFRCLEKVCLLPVPPGRELEELLSSFLIVDGYFVYKVFHNLICFAFNIQGKKRTNFQVLQFFQSVNPQLFLFSFQ